jgi:MarR family transcriptional regulator, organic hydroperoxide resistance regulator
MQNKPNILIDLGIRLTWTRIARMYNQLAAKRGFSMSMGFILLNIEKEGTPSTQLGPKMGMEPTSLSRTLKSMEEKDFIFRKADETGLEYRTLCRQVIFDFNKKILNEVSEDDLINFLNVLRKLDTVLEEHIEADSNIDYYSI